MKEVGYIMQKITVYDPKRLKRSLNSIVLIILLFFPGVLIIHTGSLCIGFTGQVKSIDHFNSDQDGSSNK